MTEGGMLKKITEAMKDLVTEANFDCSTTGVSVQAMVSTAVLCTLPQACKLSRRGYTCLPHPGA
eukprot:scaffold5777_cov101-Isochrysis_galbana.AAC.6